MAKRGVATRRVALLGGTEASLSGTALAHALAVALPAVPLGALGAPIAAGYQRRRPETTTLYTVVCDHLQTLYAAVADGFEGVW